MSVDNSLSVKQLAAAASAFAAVAYILKHMNDCLKPALPPGPKRFPLIGHLLSMPRSSEHVAYARMGEELNSDIIALSVMGQTIVVLNSTKATSDLLDKRSSIYSGRPRIPVITDKELMDWGQSMIWLDNDARWKRDRRLLHESLHKGAVPQYYPGQERKIHALIRRLVSAPSTLESFEEQVGFTFRAGMVYATYGYTAESLSDEWLEKLREAVEHVDEAGLPTTFMVNFIPALKYLPEWLPGTGWKKVVRRWREEKEYITSTPYAWTKEQMRNNCAAPSIVQKILSAFPGNTPDPEDDLQIELMSSVLFGAGSHTSVASSMFFLLAMVLYPEVALKIQAEVDGVLGNAERLPRMQDYDHMPYVQNVILELLRWQPVTPLGIPHALMEDDVYRGYYLPKGSIVMGNTWAITRNESVYPNPERFDPDRFLDPNVPHAPAFGYGRRVCPGNHFAEANLFLLVSSLMCVFDIRRAIDKDGNEIVPEVKTGMASNLARKPEPFKFVMQPRSEAHKRLAMGLGA